MSHLRIVSLAILLRFVPIAIVSSANDYTPECPSSDFSGYASGPACESYFICADGTVVSPVTECMYGTIFNEWLSVCDFAANFECGSTRSPTNKPTKQPTVSPTTKLMPTTPSPTLPPVTRSPNANVGVEDALYWAKHDINRKLFVYEAGWGNWRPSTQYRYDGFIRGLQLMYLEGVGDMTFYLGGDVSGEEGVKIGLVNIAAFLAQSMKETIKYNACDENNWDIIDGQYPLSNACGQLEQSYQDYVCPEGSEHMQCEVDLNMEQRASTTANWYGAPGPLFCGPKSKYPFVGYWDFSHMCDFPWKDPPEYCTDYPGQKGGQFVNDEPVENQNGRTDVEGCCWWGRGVIQTTGICNFGMLNYFLGKRAADEGRESRYPHIDFCKDPGAICSREEHPELKWIAGMFYWIRSLQTYNDGWSYMDNLKAFVRGGMTDDAFIDSVSGIVNRGCHNPPCGSGSLDGGYERKENFKKVLSYLLEADGRPRVFRPLDEPTYFPTYNEDEGNDQGPAPVDPAVFGRPTPRPTDGGGAQTFTIANNGPANLNEQWVDSDENEEGEEDRVPPPNSDQEEEEEDWGPPNQEKVEEEEDWSDTTSSGGSSKMNLWCGETQTDAFENCNRNGYDCQDGICFSSLRCFMTPDCSEEDEEITTNPPTPKPPTQKPTTPANNLGLQSQFCAKTKADLPAVCITARTCVTKDDCPPGTHCWQEHLCSEATKPPTPAPKIETIPTYAPTYSTYSPTKESDDNAPPLDVSTGQNSGDITSTFFCGTDRTHASTSCHKHCPSGSPDECEDGEACFGNISCQAEVPKANDETEQPSDGSIAFDITSTFFCGTDRTHASTSCHKRCPGGSPDECGEGEACFGYTSCEAEVPPESVMGGTTVELESQITPEPTNMPTNKPTARMTLKPIPLPTPKPVNKDTASSQSDYPDSAAEVAQQQFFCSKNMDDLEESCGSAQSCLSGPCPSGMFCFPFTCATTVKDPADNEPPAQAPAGIKEDGSDQQQTPADDATQTSGKPAKPADNQPQQQQPASPPQQFAELCPLSSYVGYYANQDCKEYWYCDNGVPGVIRSCGASLKFDKVLDQCNSEAKVNNFCYGPALPEGTTASSKGLCKEGFTGYETRFGCKEYYWCNNGNLNEGIRECGKDLLFDKVLNQCNSQKKVNSSCRGPPLPAGTTAASKGLCKNGYTGWEARLGCKEYYWCSNGALNQGIIECGDGLLFDRELELCNFANTVHCPDKGGPSTPRPTPKPVFNGITFPPTASESPSIVEDGASGQEELEQGGFVTPSPSIYIQSETPPWLMNTVMTKGDISGSSTMCSVCLIWLVCMSIQAIAILR